MQEVNITEDQPTASQEPTKSPISFPEPPIPEKKGIKIRKVQRQVRFKSPAWLLVAGGVLAGLMIGVFVMHQRAVSRSIIVSVNGTTITEDQLLAQMQAQSGIPAAQKLILEELQLQFAEKKGLAPTDAEVEAQYEKIKARPNFDQALAVSGISEKDVKHSLRVEMAQVAVISQGITVSDAEARSYYQTQINPATKGAKFYHPPVISLRAIETTSLPKANQALADLAAKTPFELAAASYSEDPSKQNGGLLSPQIFGRSPLHADPALEQKIFRMKVGDQIGPVFFAKQWWIFQCQDKIAATTDPYEQVKDLCFNGEKLAKGTAVNGAKIQAEFDDFKHAANLQAFWPQYQKAIVFK